MDNFFFRNIHSPRVGYQGQGLTPDRERKNEKTKALLLHLTCLKSTLCHTKLAALLGYRYHLKFRGVLCTYATLPNCDCKKVVVHEKHDCVTVDVKKVQWDEPSWEGGKEAANISHVTTTHLVFPKPVEFLSTPATSQLRHGSPT
ncbi:unnamed protein product [Acanthoscelides obtectus]|uniref:Uncharacterized protein n=1 Tax=Acanthoscelides obtectus TaxID=200917 RepID=A0A9P0NV65_ACAOB|nr:unnamed protein product [Acanthoscelides obtectus]CAK1672905.1 hypothetical protein AOBTE_LOCUS29137 [Acanthoscelides obtectus]